ncbi:MAG: copper-binding protein [Deltaproteobacteria bacterium]|nr:copper-binding protein [Deltaproteobacteria bacterium]
MRITTLALALAGALLAACVGGAANEGDGTGVVRAIAPDGARVTLEHGDIPGLMQAMTMDFAVAQPAQLAGVEVGETVEFHLVYDGGAYTITELREVAP